MGAQRRHLTDSTGRVPKAKWNEGRIGHHPSGLFIKGVSGRVEFLERNHPSAAEAQFQACLLSDSILTADESEGELMRTESATWPASGAWAAVATLTSAHRNERKL